MEKVETGCKSIFKFNNVLRNSFCDQLTKEVIEIKTSDRNPDLNVMPWHDNDSLDWTTIRNPYIYAKIESYVEYLTYIVSSSYNIKVYPHFVDIVLWRSGRSMDRHVDNGWTDEEQYLRQRAFTTITYLNDNYVGGETYITSEHDDYVSIPKKGSVVIMKSNSDNAHGVNKVTEGIRVTLPVWFTKNYEHGLSHFR
jgi:hypothetical protein